MEQSLHNLAHNVPVSHSWAGLCSNQPYILWVSSVHWLEQPFRGGVPPV